MPICRLMTGSSAAIADRQHAEALVESLRELLGESALIRAAASSKASGISSSRRQISATRGTLSTFKVKRGVCGNGAIGEERRGAILRHLLRG